MSLRSSLGRVARWTLPAGLHRWVVHSRQRIMEIRHERYSRRVTADNARLKDLRRGARCFVIATGPSIARVDLTRLHGEPCIATSEFFRHLEYRSLRPFMYCRAALHEPFTDEDLRRTLQSFQEASWGGEVCLFSLSDREIIESIGGLSGAQQRFYVDYSGGDEFPPRIDLTLPVPSPQSAALTGVWAALYLGYREIILLGCDFDTVWRWRRQAHIESEHFYEGSPILGYEPMDIGYAMRSFARVREQFAATRRLAEEHGAVLVNASPGSYLDTVPLVPYDSLFP